MSNKELKEMLNKIEEINCKENFVFFNNVFFKKRSNSCLIKKLKIKYAAVCNAIEFSKLI